MTRATHAIAAGLEHHAAGRLDQAEALYRQALGADPGNIDAQHFLGVVAHQRRDHARAVELISAALARHRANPPAWSNLGLALAAQGKQAEALDAFLEALALQPDYPDALTGLGDVLRARGKLRRAEACYRRALSLVAAAAPARVGLARKLEQLAQSAESAGIDTAEAKADALLKAGNAHQAEGRIGQAIGCYRQAAALAPEFPEAHVNLGSSLAEQGNLAGAVSCARKALALDPGLPAAQFNLGVFAFRLGDWPLAKAAFGAYAQSQPHDALALRLLAETHSRLNELDEAVTCLERALAREPDDADSHSLLGNIRRNQARHGEAMAHYKAAIRHGREPVVAFQNLLFCMMCMAEFSAADIRTRHHEFAERFERPLLSTHAVSTRPAFRNARDPERRLRVGYVSPDFRAHITGHYVQPILEHHDRAQFEIHGYFIGAVADAATGRLASLVDRWHDVRALSDDDFARQVREDGIDVLVDLCGHGPGNRVLAYVRRPAPVQVNYLDYSATTGLSSIDYRLTTEYCDPAGCADRYYSEELYRLKGTYWTYNPPVQLPVAPLPMKTNGYATFGSFNLYYRITDAVLELWARVLREVPGSRLLIVSVAPGATQARLQDRLGRAGVAADRLAVHGVLPYDKYHELIGAADIALAPFPYNGATTAMDCLWNGVPVVCKAGGETFYSRLGCAVLDGMGLQELIAADDAAYVRLAAGLARDAEWLAALRQDLRPRLERSPMRDFAGFTRGLEAAYRDMWRRWCVLA